MIAIHEQREYAEPPRNLNGYDPLRDADGFTWSPEHARLLVDFFREMLCLTSGEHTNKPFIPQKWQADWLATLNGWRDADGNRRYREALFAVPRKNGKTETGAGLALYMLGCDGVQRGEVYSAALTRDQASRVFEPAALMARRSPVLARRYSVTQSYKKIDYVPAASYYRALSADAGNAHGLNPHCVLFDELHNQRTRDLYDALKSGQGARPNRLFVSLTTAGHGRESICREIWDAARNVRDGLVSLPRFLPLIYEIKEGDDWTDEEVWRACNPNLGVTVPLDFYRDELAKAKATPAYENTFRNLYLNQWTEQATRWLSMQSWDECGAEPLDMAALLGSWCWGALDLSTTTDLTAFVLAFPLGDGCVAILPHFWRPEATAREASKRDHVDYLEWSRRGWLTLTPGSVVDHDRVRRDINELGQRYSIREIAADRWNAAQILTQLAGDGFAIVEHGQGYGSMSAPSKEFERLVVGRSLRHGGHPVLRWNAANVAVETDAAGNVKPTKGHSSGRIDGIVAAVMACGRALTQAPRATPWFVT